MSGQPGGDGDGAAPVKKPRKQRSRSKMSKTSKRRIDSLDKEIKAMKLRQCHFKLREIAAELKCSVSNAGKLVERGMARLEEECKDEAREVKRMMIERYYSAMPNVSMAADKGDPQAVLAMLRLDERLCQLLSIRLFKQEVVELGGPGGGPIPMASTVTSLDALSYDERVKLLREMSGTAGPPAGGFYRASGPKRIDGDEGGETLGVGEGE